MKQVKDIIIFLGPPGAGKGSLAQLCVDTFGWVQLSTGFLCRKHIAEQTELGKSIDFSIKSGKLIEDNLIIAMVEHWLLNHAHLYNGIILDGFPRTVAQAQALSSIMKSKVTFCRLNIVKLFASDDTIKKRLSYRFVCQNKDCQRIYSAGGTNLAPKELNACDICRCELVRRSDDAEHTVHERLKAYKGYEQPLVEFYVKQGQAIAELNVEKPLSDVFEDFKKCLLNVYDNN